MYLVFVDKVSKETNAVKFLLVCQDVVDRIAEEGIIITENQIVVLLHTLIGLLNTYEQASKSLQTPLTRSNNEITSTS